MTSAHTISFNEVEEAVRRALNDSSVKLIDFSVEPLSKQWGGMMGAHFSLTARISDSSSTTTSTTIIDPQKLKFFAKTPLDSSPSKSLVDDRLNPEEVNFFQKIYPRMRATDKWSPKCHFASNQLLVFEDLRLRGFAIRESGLFDVKTLQDAVETLASFHASSIALEKDMGGRLDEVYPDAFQEKIFCDGDGKCARANRVGFETLRLLAEHFGLDVSIVSRILGRICEIVRPRTGYCNVICHGDLWRSNIMFADGSSGSTNCLLVDYQMLRYASPALDLAMLLYVHTDPNPQMKSSTVREAMVLYYCEALRKALIDLGVKDTFTKDIFEDFDRCKLMGAAQASTRWPPIVFRSIMKDPVALEKWYFHERIEVYREYMRQNPDYEKMMREYLVQLIDEGKKALEV